MSNIPSQSNDPMEAPSKKKTPHGNQSSSREAGPSMRSLATVRLVPHLESRRRPPTTATGRHSTPRPRAIVILWRMRASLCSTCYGNHSICASEARLGHCPFSVQLSISVRRRRSLFGTREVVESGERLV
jgi:hypothetical protein